MTKEPFGARGPDLDIDELEKTRTAVWAKVHPDEIGHDVAEDSVAGLMENGAELLNLGSGLDEDLGGFQLRINSIESSLDSNITTFEGEIEIEQYLDKHFILASPSSCRFLVRNQYR